MSSYIYYFIALQYKLKYYGSSTINILNIFENGNTKLKCCSCSVLQPTGHVLACLSQSFCLLLLLLHAHAMCLDKLLYINAIFVVFVFILALVSDLCHHIRVLNHPETSAVDKNIQYFKYAPIALSFKLSSLCGDKNQIL